MASRPSPAGSGSTDRPGPFSRITREAFSPSSFQPTLPVSDRGERIAENLQEVDRILGGLPHRMMRWLRDRGELPSGLGGEPGPPNVDGESGVSLARQLNRLAAAIRLAGERFHEPGRSETVARRVENVAQHLRETIGTPVRVRLHRLLRDHPVVSFSTALGMGYALYRLLSPKRALDQSSGEGVRRVG